MNSDIRLNLFSAQKHLGPGRLGLSIWANVSLRPMTIWPITVWPLSLWPISVRPRTLWPFSFWPNSHFGQSHFGPRTFRPRDYSAQGLFGPGTIRPKDYSDQGLFGPYLYYHARNRLNWIFCVLNVLYFGHSLVNFCRCGTKYILNLD